MDMLRDKHSSCAETCPPSSVNGNQFIFVNVDEVTHIKEEGGPEATAVPVIKTEPADCLALLDSDPAASCTDTCLLSYYHENQVTGIKVEEVTGIKEECDPDAATLPAVKTECESTVKEQHCAHGGKCAFSCDVCDKPFSNRTSLVRHTWIHSGERPFCCDVCNKKFAYRSRLITHKRVHSGERPFSCDVCNKAFSQQANLTRHQRIHSGERPFCCNMCNRAFGDQSHLITHKRAHIREQSFSCDVCSKAFVEEANLMKHKRIHSGEPPFYCDVCSKAFVQHTDLTRHKRIHSGERPFCCGECDKAFAQRSDMMRHMRTHNRELLLSKLKQMTHKRTRKGEQALSVVW